MIQQMTYTIIPRGTTDPLTDITAISEKEMFNKVAEIFPTERAETIDDAIYLLQYDGNIIHRMFVH